MARIKPQVVLLTGGSSGIGLATARLLMWQGHTVYSCSRRGGGENQSCTESGGKIIGLHGDVTQPATLQAAVDRILQEQGHLESVICNAGNGIAGAIEDTTDEEARYQFETCFFGTANTIRVCLPVLRQQGHGRIIATASVASVIPVPFQAYYSAAKAALLLYMEALSMEVKPFGVQCGCVLPGDTRTNFTDSRKYTIASQQPESVYAKAMQKAVGKMEQDERNGMKPECIADAIAAQVNRKRVKPVVVPGINYKLICRIMQLFPASWSLPLIHSTYS